MVQVSVQLYSLRSLEEPSAMLDAVSEAGFSFVEFYGSKLAEAALFEPLLAARGLRASGSHVAIKDLVDAPETVIANAKRLGICELFVPSVPVERRGMDATGWRDVGVLLARLSNMLAAHDIVLGYHNHDWDLQPKEGDLTPLDLIFSAAGSAPLRWEADIAWLVRAGVGPVVWLERYKDRLAAAHVKDLAPIGTNEEEAGWADVGAGTLDWPVLWEAAVSRGAKWMVVEHDKPLDPARTVANSLRYLKGAVL